MKRPVWIPVPGQAIPGAFLLPKRGGVIFTLYVWMGEGKSIKITAL
jgi:hypothetical protein